MSAISIGRAPRSRRSVALTWLNGAMALLCGVVALLVGVLIVETLLLGMFQAIHWPQHGVDWSFSGLSLHASPATVTVNSSRCIESSGHAVCRPVSSTHLVPVAFNADSVVTFTFSVIFVLPLAALSYGLAHASACFVALARRRWFARRTITHLRDFALGGLVFMALLPAASPMIHGLNAGWAAIHHWQVSGGTWTWDLGPIPTLLTVVYATLLALITAVLAHARSVAEDHAQIV